MLINISQRDDLRTDPGSYARDPTPSQIDWDGDVEKLARDLHRNLAGEVQYAR